MSIFNTIADFRHGSVHLGGTVIEGYENQVINPYLIAGTTVHNIPQTFAVHGGTYSLYLNFINCVGSTGTCAGAKVFEQPFVVCPGMPVRLSTYLATSFSGTQCNVRITITDANGTMLNDQPSISAPYSPSWYQYHLARYAYN
ncbi:MAG: hypothetical protein IPN13_18965 [Bacteroidetes bacterium]|nr:hypothetical protein [Bacteroidota bacterium]